MAAWQEDFVLITTRPWQADYRTQLDAIAPRSQSWSPEIETWGTEDGNRIDVYLESGVPTDGLLRIDLREWNRSFITEVLKFLQRLGVGLATVSGLRVEPNLGEVALALRGSPAFRFVEDPERFLRRLELGGLEDA